MKRNRQTDYSPLFEGLLRSGRLPIEDRVENGERFSVIRIQGVEVRGSRQILERVRSGLLRNGGPQHISV